MFVKYCSKKYHAGIAKEIQIGTLEYYREHDNEFIRDINEGKQDKMFHPDKSTVLTSEKFKEKFNLPLKVNGNVAFAGGSLVKNLTLPNVYVFCCSIADSLEQINPSLLGNDSFYIINDVNNFAEYIGGELIKKVKIKNTADKIIGIKWFLSEVKYVDEKLEKYTSLDSYTDEVSIDSLFVKNKFSQSNKSINFEKNKEFRFVWIPYGIDGNAIAVEKQPILITNTSILKSFLTL